MVGINEISDKVANRAKTTPEEAKKIIYAFLDSIVEYLEKGYVVNIRGLGIFYARYRKPRRGTNPRTGEIMIIPPRKVLTFKPIQKIKYI